eukprot:646821-Pleurochrysis_carterae.AAC.1
MAPMDIMHGEPDDLLAEEGYYLVFTFVRIEKVPRARSRSPAQRCGTKHQKCYIGLSTVLHSCCQSSRILSLPSGGLGYSTSCAWSF